jgi:hypothetical protein
MPNATVRAKARTLPEAADDVGELFRKSLEDLDETELSPAFAALHREFHVAVDGEDAAIAAFDGTEAAMARVMAAHDEAWEVWRRISASKAVYVKDLATRTAPLMWAMGRHGGRFMAEAMACRDARETKQAGRLQ